MKWTYAIKNKLSASIVLLCLCLLVLLSNYLDRKHTEHVKNSISTLYEDRLIAESYILKMTNSIYQIREVLKSDLTADSKSDAVQKLITDFNEIYLVYSKTRLTEKENSTAAELISYLKQFEQAKTDGNFQFNHTEKLLLSLSQLSTIQLEESKLIMKKVESQYATIKASSELAFAIVIIILVVLQVLVFSGESLIPVIKPKDPKLN